MSTHRVQTSANTKISNKRDPGFESRLIWMCQIYPKMLQTHYLVGVSHFAKYGTNGPLLV